MTAKQFNAFTGISAILTGLSGLAYAFSFVILDRSLPQLAAIISALFLLLGGLLSLGVIAGLQRSLRSANEGFTLWVSILAIIGAIGAITHGGYDLANAVNIPEENPLNLANLPSQTDPRGLLTFGVTGLAILGWSWLISSTSKYPKRLSRLGYVLGCLMTFIYLARLIWIDVTAPIVGLPILLTGFVLNPLWYIWLGKIFWSKA